jgi:transposase
MAKRVSVRSLKKAEGQKILQVLRKSKDVIEVRRAEIILASEQGEGAPEIANRLYLSADYVRKVIHRFNAEGLSSLKAGYENGGRPPTIFPEHQSELIELAMTPPRLTGQPFNQWSLEKLREVAVKRKLIPDVSIETVRLILKKHRLSLQRSKTWKESNDPQFDEKKTPSKNSTARRRKGKKR